MTDIKVILMKQKIFSIRYVLFLLNILIIHISFAQQPINNNQKDYRAVLWNSADGLSLGKKNIMLKDVNGFLWIISPIGLNRFDGSNFKIYYTDKTRPGTINGSYSFSLVEDSLHNIWIGTNKGLSRYDIKNDTFKNFSAELPSVTSVASIIPFWATRDELYCMEGGYRVTVYNIHSFEKKIVATLDKNGPAMNHITIPQSIYDATSNSIWILYGENGRRGGGLLQVALSEKKIIRHEWACYKKIPDHSHYSYGMHYDSKRNSIWLNSVEGLLEFTLRDKKFHEIAACNELMNLDNYEMIAGIELNAEGKVLLYRYSKGIIVYDPATQTVQPLFSDPDLQQKVSDENMSIYCDRDGMIWCGYLPTKGIYQLIPFTTAVSRIPINAEQSLNKSTIPVLHMMQAGTQIWISTVDALNIFDPGSNSLKRLNTQDLPGLKNGNIVPLGMDNISQKAWVTTWNSGTFYEMDMQSRVCRNLPVMDINHKEIFDIYPNEKTASKYKNGLIFLVDNMGIFTVTKDSAIVQQVLAIPYHVTNMAVAAGKRIFLRLHFANTNLSYYETNGKWVQTATAIDSIEWSCIFYDAVDQGYWAGGVKQLYHFDRNFKLIRRYTDKDGLPGIDVMNIIKDDIGNIWFNNSQGHISRVNAKSGVLTVLSEKDGYKMQEFRWQTPQFKDRNGDLYFAGVDGIDRVSPDKLDLFPPSIVYLQSLEVNQHSPSLKTGINDLKEISLKYFENTVLIETGVIDYYSKGKSSIRYKLESVNDTWQYAPANYAIRFEKLPPGKYKLFIQASNSGNNFNSPGKSLLIMISPAFWNTWWFRAIAIVCMFALFYSLIRFRLRQKFLLRLERSDKERQVAELRQRTTELEMQALRAQMNPHFIFNSLNSINRFILQNNKSQASEYLTKFSKLVRMILQNSQAESITLESELESLQLYLELEAVRFDHHFEFKISVADDLETNIIKVPPLIIQPYTENAIWHGLMHKEEKGHLEIKLYQQEDLLCCLVTDDGIGRNKAAELKSKSASTHKSMGMQITASRIEMMKQKKQMDSYIKVTDLVFADGSVGGTEVLLKIPVQYD
jgi:ligand-binding sensor domain-containing protein